MTDESTTINKHHELLTKSIDSLSISKSDHTIMNDKDDTVTGNYNPNINNNLNNATNLRKQKLQWDEVTIAEHDKERGSRQKIDEAPTPYRYGSESDQSECESDGETLRKSDPSVNPILGILSPKPVHTIRDSWETVNAKLQYEKRLQELNMQGNEGEISTSAPSVLNSSPRALKKSPKLNTTKHSIGSSSSSNTTNSHSNLIPKSALHSSHKHKAYKSHGRKPSFSNTILVKPIIDRQHNYYEQTSDYDIQTSENESLHKVTGKPRRNRERIIRKQSERAGQLIENETSAGVVQSFSPSSVSSRDENNPSDALGNDLNNNQIVVGSEDQSGSIMGHQHDGGGIHHDCYGVRLEGDAQYFEDEDVADRDEDGNIMEEDVDVITVITEGQQDDQDALHEVLERAVQGHIYSTSPSLASTSPFSYSDNNLTIPNGESQHRNSLDHDEHHPRTTSDSVSNGFQNGFDYLQGMGSTSSEPGHKMNQFRSKRANHYNEYKVLQAMRSMKHDSDEEEEEN